MAAEKHEATTIVLGKTKGKLVRFSYLHAFKPHMNRESKRQEFSVQIMIPKGNTEDEANIRAAIKAQQDILWPTGKIPPKSNFCLKDGDTHVSQKGDDRKVPGYWLLTAKTDAYERGPNNTEILTSPNAPPEVAGTTRGADGKLELLTSAQVKSGDWGRVSVNIKSYLTGDTGVTAYLNSLQKVQSGDPLASGRRSAASEFDDFDDEDEDGDDPLG